MQSQKCPWINVSSAVGNGIDNQSCPQDPISFFELALVIGSLLFGALILVLQGFQTRDVQEKHPRANLFFVLTLCLACVVVPVTGLTAAGLRLLNMSQLSTMLIGLLPALQVASQFPFSKTVAQIRMRQNSSLHAKSKEFKFITITDTGECKVNRDRRDTRQRTWWERIVFASDLAAEPSKVGINSTRDCIKVLAVLSDIVVMGEFLLRYHVQSIELARQNTIRSESVLDTDPFFGDSPSIIADGTLEHLGLHSWRAKWKVAGFGRQDHKSLLSVLPRQNPQWYGILFALIAVKTTRFAQIRKVKESGRQIADWIEKNKDKNDCLEKAKQKTWDWLKAHGFDDLPEDDTTKQP